MSSAAIVAEISPETKGLTKPSNAVQLYAFGDLRERIVKIGFTRSKIFEGTRKKSHETRGPRNSTMVTFGAWWGMQSDEKCLKDYFAHLTLPNRDEWFNCDDELLDWLKTIRKAGFVAHNQKELDVAPFVDSRDWLPGRVKFGIPAYITNKQIRLPFQEIDDDTAGVWGDIMQSHDRVGEGDYYSPESFIEPARIAFGGQIDCDPASCREADKVVRALRYYTWREDGLIQPWFGRVWLNPPYSQWDLWGDQLLKEMSAGRVTEAIVVATTRVTSAQYFFRITRPASAYLQVNGRYQFWGPKASKADEGHALYYFGPNPQNFARAYQGVGKTWFA